MKRFLILLKWIFIISAFAYFIYAAFLLEPLEYQKRIDRYDATRYKDLGGTALTQSNIHHTNSFKQLLKFSNTVNEITIKGQIDILRNVDHNQIFVARDDLMILVSPKFNLVAVYEWVPKKPIIKMTLFRDGKEVSQNIGEDLTSKEVPSSLKH